MHPTHVIISKSCVSEVGFKNHSVATASIVSLCAHHQQQQQQRRLCLLFIRLKCNYCLTVIHPFYAAFDACLRRMCVCDSMVVDGCQFRVECDTLMGS